MSTDYDAYCLDCEEHLGLTNVRQSEIISAILIQAPRLARFAQQLRDFRKYLCTIKGNTVEVGVTAGITDCPFDVGWFLEHEGHSLGVRDEYGRMLDECSVQFSCPTCRVHERCRRPVKHEGEHRNVRDVL